MDIEPFGDYKGTADRRAADASTAPLTPAELHARVRAATGREPLLLGGGAERDPLDRHRLGLGRRHARTRRSRAGLDAFLTGEPREHITADAEELGIHFVAAGHYATETFGVARWATCWRTDSGSSTSFVDLPNPV